MPVVNYHVANGRMRGQSTAGSRTDYLTDALGSMTGTVTSTSALKNAYRHKPYGQPLSKTGSGVDPRFLWTGDTGSRTTGTSNAEQYNRARHYGAKQAGWTSVDPLWPEESAYGYVGGNPTSWIDPSGMQEAVTAGAAIGTLICPGAGTVIGAGVGLLVTACVGAYVYETCRQNARRIEMDRASSSAIPAVVAATAVLTTCDAAKKAKLLCCENKDEFRKSIPSTGNLLSGIGGKRSCKGVKDCGELQTRLLRNVCCIVARKAVTKLCFEGIWNQIHRDEHKEAVLVARECVERIRNTPNCYLPPLPKF
ncbi:MAG: hypothetical protein EON58_02555 [Alphaproteobacteria bacterium]|nr:MAG: hypothetical protein EON58_02555 [Alphaproteobacteria bacterium]